MMWTQWISHCQYKFLIGILLIICPIRIEIFAAEPVYITLEFAETPEELAWGLMGRDRLNDNSAMLFIFKTPTIISTWMYNTFIDLSIAFLDEENRIKEIHQMQAFPEKMKKRIKPNELNNISFSDPIVDFFFKKRVFSNFAAKYALEVNSGWFEKNHVSVGDILVWQPNQSGAKILKDSQN